MPDKPKAEVSITLNLNEAAIREAVAAYAQSKHRGKEAREVRIWASEEGDVSAAVDLVSKTSANKTPAK